MLQPSRIIARTVLIAAAACSHPEPKAPEAAPPTAGPSPTAPAADPYAAIDAAGKAVTAEFLRDHITKISSDEFEGRGPMTRGDLAARTYLAEQLKTMGFEPGDGTSWEQPVELVGIKSEMPAKWTFHHGGKSVSLAWYDQFIAGSGVQTDRVAINNAELVFVGYGIQAPEYGWDDFKGKDLKGKILVIMNNDPDWDPALFAGPTRLYYGRWDYKYESAARQGAAGAIIIHTTPSAGYPFQVVQTSWSGEKFELPAGGEPRIQVKAWATEDAVRSVVALAGKDLSALVESARHKEFTPVPLGITTSLGFTTKIQRGKSANVWGIQRGSDPVLGKELVVFSAHHDHLGIRKPDATGDKIYNGALDNATGCAEVLAIARAVKALPTPPRRSVLILFVAGEEQGLLGSLYFSQHPIVPTGKIAADINYDGGDIWGKTRDVTYVGKGKTTLDSIVDDYAARQGRTVKPDQFPDRGAFYRSDQFSFARVGVPGLYLHTGTDFVGRPAGWGREQIEQFEKTRYHQASDQISPDWNFEGMIDDVRLGFAVGIRVASADQLPGWVPGDEFEGARKKSLAQP